MRMEIRGVRGQEALRAHVSAKLTALLARHDFRPTSAEVGFADDNGPKSGSAIRCLIEVRLPRREPLDVHHIAEDARLGFDGALEKLDRQLGRSRARQRARARRPKKYYTAKRLLTEGLDAPESRAS